MTNNKNGYQTGKLKKIALCFVITRKKKLIKLLKIEEKIKIGENCCFCNWHIHRKLQIASKISHFFLPLLILILPHFLSVLRCFPSIILYLSLLSLFPSSSFNLSLHLSDYMTLYLTVLPHNVIFHTHNTKYTSLLKKLLPFISYL